MIREGDTVILEESMFRIPVIFGDTSVQAKGIKSK
jgi:hypothetical protein